MIDAKNAIIQLNRKLALLNIPKFCPSLAKAVKISYQSQSNPLVENDTLLSAEDTTQVDPFAMAMYGIAIVPFIRDVQSGEIVHK